LADIIGARPACTVAMILPVSIPWASIEGAGPAPDHVGRHALAREPDAPRVAQPVRGEWAPHPRSGDEPRERDTHAGVGHEERRRARSPPR
jgi:hypothetical protein